MNKLMDYMAARVLEQSSFTAYIAAVVAATSSEIPSWAKGVVYAAATYKWLMPEGKTLCHVGFSTLRNLWK